MVTPRILIVKTSSMGDVIHALPLVSDIAAARPELAIDWVVEEGFADLPRLHPQVARVVPVALRRWRRAWWQADTWRELRAARTALRAQPYQTIIDCQGLLKSAWVARWARGPVVGLDAASAREPLAARLYLRRVVVPRALHAVERNRLIGAGAVGYAVEGAPRFGLQVPPQTEPTLAACAEAGPYAVLLTNASRATKRWPDDRWQAVARSLSAQGLRVLLFWGSAQEEADTQRRAAGMANAWVAPRCTLPQVAAALASARLVIGLDTGLSHLAAAAGTPAVGIYCDYDPRLVGLVGDAPSISLGGVEAMPTVDGVLAAAARVMAGGD